MTRIAEGEMYRDLCLSKDRGRRFSSLLLVRNKPLECEINNILRREEERCFETISNDKIDSKTRTFEAGCDRMWDNLTCWPPSSFGKTVAVPCPKVFYVLTHKEGVVYRNCTSDGWSEQFTAYAIACGYDVNDTQNSIKSSVQLYILTFLILLICIFTKQSNYMNIKIMYTVGHSTSFISLTIAVAILGLFRKLHCTRNYIHMHLFVSYMFRAISIFIKDRILFSSEAVDHCSAYSVECKFALIFFQYCTMANFSWLLVEALYLHTLLVVSVFSEQKYFWWFIILGWGKFQIRVAQHFLFHLGQLQEEYMKTLDVYFYSILQISFVLFLHIIRILIKKLKTPDVMGNEFNQYKRLAKSTFLLIPLFGVHYIVFIIFPETEGSLAIELRICLELFLGSFQVCT
ncbi:secretin receptor-like [Leucoraja erinacea]|uniref:secretin receptor-like n=1 Tax=Leucoraja erinaceus TaxID=7782 RepID=UPI0024547034|nr:secretin receptor-like [Leucoraja erinacea]